MILYLFLIIFFCFLLIKATDILIINFKALTEKTNFGKFALTGLILGLATSLPEYFVGITSAIKQTPNLSLGNIVGANIANLSLVVGGAALIGGSVSVSGLFFHREIFYALLVGALPMFLLLDKNLSRIDGLILLLLYGFYQVCIFKERSRRKEESSPQGFVHRLFRRLNHRLAKQN